MPFDVSLLRELTLAPGPTGFEGPIQRLVRQRLAAVSEPQTDALGNVWATVGAGGLSVAVVAHADQIGMVVTYVDDHGFLSFERIGGVDRQLLPGHAVAIHTHKGTVDGVVGRQPTHFIPTDKRGRAPEFHEQYIDIGAADRDAALARVSLGDPVTFAPRFIELAPDVCASLACDDRAGIYVALRALQLYGAQPGPASLTAIATVHEETTFMGARAKMVQGGHDVVIVVDGDFATDQPDVDIKKAGGEVKLGAGPVLARGTGSNEVLFRRAVAVAEREGIPFQVKAAPGAMSTDADELMASPRAATLSIGLPMRYMHAPFEVLRGADLEATAALIVALTRDLEGVDLDSFLW